MYLEDCLYNCLDTSGKKIPHFFGIIVQNSRNSRLEQAKIVKKGPIAAQILSAIKLNEQLSTDSQCNG